MTDYFLRLLNDVRIHSDHLLMFGMAILSSSICSWPYLLGLSFCYDCRGDTKGSEHDQGRGYKILESMQSLVFQFSLISTISVCVLIYFDYFLSRLTLGKMRNKTGAFAHIVLVSSLFFPSIIILFVAVPQGNPGIIVLCFQARLCFALYAIIRHLWDFGPSVFRSRFVWWAYVFFQLATCCRTVSTFTTTYYEHFYYGFISCAALGSLLLQVPVLHWIQRLSSTPFKSLTTSDLSCTAYLTLTVVSSGTIVVMYASLPFSDNRFLSGVTIVGMLFTMTVSVIRSQLASYEAILAQQELLEAKEVLVRYFSHELRTPLNILSLGLEALEDGLKKRRNSEDTLNIVTDMRSSCKTSVDILNELLACGSQVSGLISLERTMVPVSSLLQDSIGPLKHAARLADVRVVEASSEDGSLSDVDKRNTIVRVDVKKLTRALQALISYTISRSRGGNVTISCCIIPNNSGVIDVSNSCDKMLRIKVVDQGAEMSPDDLERLFVDDAMAESGLILCKTVLDLHQGSVTATSAGTGGGCAFTVDLPFSSAYSNKADVGVVAPTGTRNDCTVADASPSPGVNREILLPTPLSNRSSQRRAPVHPQDAVDETARIEAHTSVGQRELVPMHRMSRSPRIRDMPPDEKEDSPAGKNNDAVRILIVDDSPMNRHMLRRGVSQEYSCIDEAEDGLDAVNKVEQALKSGSPYSVILMDFQMPNMDGPTATAILREKKFDGPIIGVTGNALPRDTEFFISKGADQVMLKPVSSADLLAAIREHLAERRRRPRLLSQGPRTRQPQAASSERSVRDEPVIEIHDVIDVF